MVLCGINSRFQLLSPCVRQVTHALLTRPPLSIEKSIRKLHSQYSVRLACVKHAASVHPEPGSNSHVKVLSGQENVDFSQFSYPFTVCLYFRTFKKFTFVPRPFGCWTFKKFQGCLYCLIFDFQGSRLISQPAQKEGFEPSRRFYPTYPLSRGASSAT